VERESLGMERGKKDPRSMKKGIWKKRGRGRRQTKSRNQINEERGRGKGEGKGVGGRSGAG